MRASGAKPSPRSSLRARRMSCAVARFVRRFALTSAETALNRLPALWPRVGALVFERDCRALRPTLINAR